MRIVVVGATGNIGTAILRRLHEAGGHDLVGLCRRLPQATGPYTNVEWHSADVAAADAVGRLTGVFSGADAVIHLAWILQPNHNEKRLWLTNVRGTGAMLAAAGRAGVPHVIIASSIGAYSAGPKNRRVDESWPTGGIHSSHYGRQKAQVERMLDAFETEYPGVVVTRIRPGLVMHREAGYEVKQLFIGPLIPTGWLTRIRLPVLPMPRQTISQVVHADDLAEAFRLAVEQRAGGAFNVAGEPVITPARVASVLGTRHLRVRRQAVRALMWATWKLHIQASDPGWLDLATNMPVMSTRRAEEVLGWAPRVDALDALGEMVHAVANKSDLPASPQLRR